MAMPRPRVFCSASPLGHDTTTGSSAEDVGLNISSANSAAAEEQLLALGRRYTLGGDLESAVRQFELAASQAPRSAVCKAELGRALVRLGRRADGFNCLVAAFGIDSLCPGVKDGFREYYRAEIEASLRCMFLLSCLPAVAVKVVRTSPDRLSEHVWYFFWNLSHKGGDLLVVYGIIDRDRLRNSEQPMGNTPKHSTTTYVRSTAPWNPPPAE